MKNCALYHTSASTLFFPNFRKYRPVEIEFVFQEDLCVVDTKQPLVFYLT